MPWKKITKTLPPWLSCLPEALFLSRKKETSLTDIKVSISAFDSTVVLDEPAMG